MTELARAELRSAWTLQLALHVSRRIHKTGYATFPGTTPCRSIVRQRFDRDTRNRRALVATSQPIVDLLQNPVTSGRLNSSAELRYRRKLARSKATRLILATTGSAQWPIVSNRPYVLGDDQNITVRGFTTANRNRPVHGYDHLMGFSPCVAVNSASPCFLNGTSSCNYGSHHTLESSRYSLARNLGQRGVAQPVACAPGSDHQESEVYFPPRHAQ